MLLAAAIGFAAGLAAAKPLNKLRKKTVSWLRARMNSFLSKEDDS
jgi:hypothetical protein